MNKKAEEYSMTTTVELFILLIVFGLLAYITFNVDTSNQINEIMAKDLGLSISFAGSGDSDVKFTHALEEEKKVTFFDNLVEVSNVNGESFQRRGFNLGKSISFKGSNGDYNYLTIKKTDGKLEIK